MSFFGSLNISASGLTAQRLRMDVLSQNLANINTTNGPNGEPYKKRIITFQEKRGAGTFSNIINRTNARRLPLTNIVRLGEGVRVSRIVEDNSEGAKIYEPNHPDADADGYVQMPNVNLVEEMVNMISASRSYEASVTAMNNTKSMMAKTLEIGR